VGPNLDPVPPRSVHHQLNSTHAIQVAKGKKYLIPGQVRTEIDDLIHSALRAVCLQTHANIINDRCHVHETPILMKIWNGA
jgi:hypothetical protein